MRVVPPKAPLLAQVPVSELASHPAPGGPLQDDARTEVRRRTGLSRARKRIVSGLFLGLGVTSVLALGRGAVAAASDGLSGDDAVLLTMLGLISLVVASQVTTLLKTLPGIRDLRLRAAKARLKRAGPVSSRPLLAQVDARAMLPRLPEVPERTGRFGPTAGTAGWVTLTLAIMAAALTGGAVVALAAIRSIDSKGWGLGTVLTLGFAILIGYGVAALSIGLVRSWFQQRRRRLRRMLMRLLRYLLRGFDRATTALPRLLGRFDGRTGLLGRGVLAVGGAAIVVAASLSMPVAAAGGVANNGENSAASPTPTSTSTTIVGSVALDHENTPGADTDGVFQGAGGVELAVSDPAPAVTVATTTLPGEETTTTSTSSTTTTTVAKTTTTTTTVPTDTTGPTVSGISDGPDPIFTSGTAPDTSQISAGASDPSGVANMTVYYRLGGGAFVVLKSVKGGSVSTTFGPVVVLGIYEYRIMATDTLGNANCKTPASCPGGTVTVFIP